MDREEVKALASVKAYLEKRIKEVEEELHMLKMLVQIVDQVLGKESFVPAAELRTAPAPQAPKQQIVEKPLAEWELVSREGEHFGRMIVFRDKAVVKIDAELHSSTPPFRTFLVSRILEGYKRKDQRRIESGEIAEDEAFNYDISIDENDRLQEIVIYNYRDMRTLQELRGAIRWTLARMYEKEYQMV
ncbi:MAG TPA: hypothetical protein ENG54_01895 [Thermofilum sp.]|nr:hypothetical protein [Thermofilum sp.]